MPEQPMVELEGRFAGVARGRTVSVRFEPKDFIRALDYQVSFKAETNTFEVLLRRGGCFEGAYRCIERFIEAKAERLDGVDGAAAGHLDLRCEMEYWMLEKVYEQFRLDLESAIAEKVAWLERVRPEKNAFGEVVVETRTRSLVGLLAHLQQADSEVRRAVLSSQTINLLKNIGLDIFSAAG